MEIKVQASRKELGGEKEEPVMTIYLYFVAIKDGKPAPVPPVMAETREEIAEFMRADERREKVKEFIEKYIEALNSG